MRFGVRRLSALALRAALLLARCRWLVEVAVALVLLEEAVGCGGSSEMADFRTTSASVSAPPLSEPTLSSATRVHSLIDRVSPSVDETRARLASLGGGASLWPLHHRPLHRPDTRALYGFQTAVLGWCILQFKLRSTRRSCLT